VCGGHLDRAACAYLLPVAQGMRRAPRPGAVRIPCAGGRRLLCDRPSRTTAGVIRVSTDRIVVGVDGSEAASRAVDWALSWARAVGSPVTIIASEAVPAGKTAESPGLGERAQHVIDGELARLGERSGEVEARALVAHPVTALLGASAEAGAVVVGTRGAGALQGSVVGSISGAVAASAQCPTVVLSPHSPTEFDPTGSIVIGFDGGESSL